MEANTRQRRSRRRFITEILNVSEFVYLASDLSFETWSASEEAFGVDECFTVCLVEILEESGEETFGYKSNNGSLHAEL